VALLIGIGLDAVASWSWWGRVPAAARLVVLGAAGAALVLPVWWTYGVPLPVQKVALPSWFATEGRTVPAGSVVLTYPFSSSASLRAEPMVWQAADDMRFRLAGGYIKVPGPHQGVIGLGPPGSATRTLDDLSLMGSTQPVTARQIGQLRAAVVRWETDDIVVTNLGPAPVEAAALFTAATGALPQVVHRAWVWHLTTAPGPPTSSAAQAASVLRQCQSTAGPGGVVAPGVALPQTMNTCVANGLAT
jgi:hypothetical protein